MPPKRTSAERPIDRPTDHPIAPPSRRVTDLPPYVFAWLDELKAAARGRGADLIDLGIGNPDEPTPPGVIDEIARAYRDEKWTHGYPPFRGTPRFLEAVSGYMRRRFGVEIDPATEALALSGGKEGIAHLTMAFAEPGVLSLVPDIHYPVHGRATPLVGGEVHWLPLRAEGGFFPDLSAVPRDVATRAKLLMLNYPHNPTGAVATREQWQRAVDFAREHGIVLVADLAYAEITFDGFVAPSVLSLPGAREVTVEFHSLSKTFNMAGSRIGFAVGRRELIDVLHAVRTNMGYGTPSAIQAGGAWALDHAAELAPVTRARYERRRDHVLAGFRELGWTPTAPGGSMFVWLPVPAAWDSQAFVRNVIDRTGVVFTPGVAFGPGGEGWFRVSLVADERVFDRAFERLASAGVAFGGSR